MTPAPRLPAHEVTLSELQEDPCPTCRRLRDQVPVAWAPVASGLVSRIVGQVLLREDSVAPAGTQGRRVAAVSSRNINSPWLPIFQENADDLADRTSGPRAPAMDLGTGRGPAAQPPAAKSGGVMS